MTARDLFWAAKILMKFTREELAAIVATGEYSSEESSRLLLDVLVERQLKCGRFGINAVNPIDEFRVEGGSLAFTNLSEKFGFVESETSYEIQWSAYDNGRDEREEIGTAVTSKEARSALPRIPDGRFLVARIRSRNEENPHWEASVDVYLRPKDGSFQVVGIERESPPMSTFPMN
jgi:hypothetical protein